MSVLSKNEIRRRIQRDEIFKEGVERDKIDQQLEPAGYILRIDREEAKIDGDIYSRRDEYPNAENLIPRKRFEIPGREIAVLSTKEKFSMPRDLVGRVGIRLSASRDGIIPLFGPQVDPGYEGRFYAVVYNASTEDFNLKDKRGILKIEFTTLSDPIPEDAVEGQEDFPLEEVDNSLPNNIRLQNQIDGLSDRLDDTDDDLSRRLDDTKSEVEETKQGYAQVVMFGVFLVATAAFTAFLPPLVTATQNMTLGLNLPSLFVGLFMLIWVGSLLTIFYRSISNATQS